MLPFRDLVPPTSANAQAARHILQKYFGDVEWTFYRSRNGRCHMVLLATSDVATVVVKLGEGINDNTILDGLALAPDRIGSGAYEAQTYVISAPFGVQATAQWCTEHCAALAATIRTLHAHKVLRDRLSRVAPVDTAHVTVPLASLAKAYADLPSGLIEGAGVERALRAMASAIPGRTALVPTHGDLHVDNILTQARSVRFVDWDGLALADAMRDIAGLLWRYVDRGKWPLFWDTYGLRYTVDMEHRFYWWLAAGSLQAAIWFASRGDDVAANGYLRDCDAAVKFLEAC